MKQSEKRRIYEFDLLRGLFIVIIIIDHLQFWPSPLKYFTGEGRLWASAAEGFFLISGLLVGYIRAHKGRDIPFKILSSKLLSRAAMLYVWGACITFAVTSFTLLADVHIHPLLPKLPEASQLTSPFIFIWNVLTTNYFNDWIYFLRLYAIMLAVTPLFIWLVRKQKEWLVALIMALAYVLSFFWAEGALQWQVLFFGAALTGYRLDSIIAWFGKRKALKTAFITILIVGTLVSVVLSYYFVLGWNYVERPDPIFMNRETYVAIRAVIDPWFTLNPLAIGRILLSFVWLGGLLMAFHTFRKQSLRWFGWILIPLGERSLSAYCLQALVLPLIVVLIQPTTLPIINALIALLVVVGLWGMLKIPIIKRWLPQ